MRAVERKEARGSLRWIRKAVNDHAELLDREVLRACGLADSQEIQWVSPLAHDDFAEYGDQDFLDRLRISLPNRALRGFWPNRGPQWDALGRLSSGEVFLVEAKANVPEIVSPATAASASSRELIEESLAETKSFLGIDPSIPWSGKLYQYANRVAHLYLLRELNAIPAFLVFVYFVGDPDVQGPESVAEWKAALTVAKRVLGLGERHRLSKYIVEVFLNTEGLRDLA
jgi:hypothetical protein